MPFINLDFFRISPMFKVFIFYLIFTPASTILGKYLTDNLHWIEEIVLGISMISNFILEYLYDKNIVFKGSIDTKNK